LKGYDEPEILRSQLSRFGPISADAGQLEFTIRSTKHFPGDEPPGNVIYAEVSRLPVSNEQSILTLSEIQ
jgi:hypothetical protein